MLSRLRPGAKLLGLIIFGIVVIVTPGWIPALVMLGIGIALVVMARIPVRILLRTLGGFAIVGAALFAFQLWQHGPERAIEVVAGIMALILAASAVTTSTTAGDMLDTITWALRPLRHLGVPSDRVALACSLAIRSIPLALAVARETLQAARARGLERNLRAFAVPFAIRMVAHARDTGAALQARGLGDDEPLNR